MLQAYLERQEIIDAEIVRTVASKLDLELLVRHPQPDLAGVLAAPLLVSTASRNWRTCRFIFR